MQKIFKRAQLSAMAATMSALASATDAMTEKQEQEDIETKPGYVKGLSRKQNKRLRFHINGESLTKQDHDSLPWEIVHAANNVVTSSKRKKS